MTELQFADMTLEIADLSSRAKSLDETESADVLGGYGYARYMRVANYHRQKMVAARRRAMYARRKAMARRRAMAKRRGARMARRRQYMARASFHSRMASRFRRMAARA